jgi:hypothetical protein
VIEVEPEERLSNTTVANFTVSGSRSIDENDGQSHGSQLEWSGLGGLSSQAPPEPVQTEEDPVPESPDDKVEPGSMPTAN